MAAVAGPARAQPNRRLARVGWLGWMSDTSLQPADAMRAFRDGLAALGWREGDNLQLLSRAGDLEHGAGLCAELVAGGATVIVAQGPMVFPARAKAGTVPLVFAINGDPVEAGLVSSLARPGGTVTGITALNTELSGKRVEMLKAVHPALARFAALGNDRHPGLRAEIEATTAAAQRLGLEMRYVPIRQQQDLEATLSVIAGAQVGGLVAFPDTLINRVAPQLAQFNALRRLPAISGWAEFTEAGNLMSYGPNHHDFFARTATFVDKLLSGAKPSDLPVEQASKFELAINLKAARSLGLTLPPSLALRADRVIE
jgi:putative tryptophan/tyrosine transport system substrate-binding protein